MPEAHADMRNGFGIHGREVYIHINRTSTIALFLVRNEFARFRVAKDKTLSKRLSFNVVPRSAAAVRKQTWLPMVDAANLDKISDITDLLGKKYKY